jgi:hypothetical protein
MPHLAARKVTIFVSSPTDVMAERDRAARVIDRLQSRFRDHLKSSGALPSAARRSGGSSLTSRSMRRCSLAVSGR